MTPKTLRFIVVVALLALPVCALALDMDCKFIADRQGKVDASGAERVEIVARAGDLLVQPATGPALSAAGRACASSQSLLDQTQLLVRRTGNVVEVEVRVPDSMIGVGIFYASLDLKVQVPDGLPVAITDSSGDVTVDGVRVVRIRDSSGDILARHLPADVEIEDSSGDVRVEDAAGHVSISDSSGDIVVERARSVTIPRDSSGDISIERVAGNVRIEQDSSGDISVSDVSGNVELLADGSGQVRVTSVQGTVRLP
jgi:hypothetical protein